MDKKIKMENKVKKVLNLPLVLMDYPLNQEQSMISDDLALGDILNEHVASKNDIAIFDRGMKNRRKMETLSRDEQYFVTRINKILNIRH